MENGEFNIVKELLVRIDEKQDQLSDKVNVIRKETNGRLDHLDECVDNVRDVVKASNERLERMINEVADSIPNRDFHGHKMAHTLSMRRATTAQELKLEAKKTAIRWALPGFMLFLGLALWEAVLVKIKAFL